MILQTAGEDEWHAIRTQYAESRRSVRSAGEVNAVHMYDALAPRVFEGWASGILTSWPLSPGFGGGGGTKNARYLAAKSHAPA